VIVIAGVSGCGKTTIGKALSEALAGSFLDGDDFHPQTNIDKMTRGESLNDDDRKPWLAAIHQHLCRTDLNPPVVLACSALKEQYRHQLSQGLPQTSLFWVFLTGDFQVIQKRIENRTDHFMPAHLLRAQFDTFEKPSQGLVLDIQHTVEEQVAAIMARIIQ